MQRCQQAGSDQAVIGALTAAAGEHVLAQEPEPLTYRLAALVCADMSVAELADRLGLTVRQVHRHCVEEFGLPPSVLRRVARLHRAARLHREGGAGSGLAGLALGAGYADQAHMSREIRALTGLTPGAALS